MIGAARFRRRTETSASTAASRNASHWACHTTVSVTAARGQHEGWRASCPPVKGAHGLLCFSPWLFLLGDHSNPVLQAFDFSSPFPV